jgi:hypothetical protein
MCTLFPGRHFHPVPDEYDPGPDDILPEGGLFRAFCGRIFLVEKGLLFWADGSLTEQAQLPRDLELIALTRTQRLTLWAA